MKKALASIAASIAQSPSASALNLHIQETFSVRLSRAPGGIVVGNPAVASVRLQDSMTLVIAGKTSGTTSILVRDETGRELWASQIAVRAASKLRAA